MKSEFEKSIENPQLPIAIDFSSKNRSLLIAFGGIAGKMGVTPFEFFNMSRGFNVNRIYVRDLAQVWYHVGLPGIADDIDGVVSFLREKISQSHVNKVILVGNSMGGYAAILFGILLDADIVHAFSPQTFIDRRNRFRYFDRRWRKQMKNTYRLADKKYFDLRSLFHGSQVKLKCKFNIFYSNAHRLDRIHAGRLRSQPNVNLHAFEDGGHRLVKHLRDTGKLNKIINESL